MNTDLHSIEHKRELTTANLIADENGNSVKFAKYAGRDRATLIENDDCELPVIFYTQKSNSLKNSLPSQEIFGFSGFFGMRGMHNNLVVKVHYRLGSRNC